MLLVCHDYLLNLFPFHFVAFCFYRYTNFSSLVKHKNILPVFQLFQKSPLKLDYNNICHSPNSREDPCRGLSDFWKWLSKAPFSPQRAFQEECAFFRVCHHYRSRSELYMWLFHFSQPSLGSLTRLVSAEVWWGDREGDQRIVWIDGQL